MTDKEKELVRMANEWYKGKKSMSDKDFDRFENEVKAENPDFNYRLYLDLDGETVNHPIKFPYLDKKQIDKYDLERSDIKKLLNSLENKGYLMYPKLSGCSLVEYYDEDGNLEDIITKSNDFNGKRKMKSFKGMVPHKVPKGIRAINNEVIVDLNRGFGYISESKANGLVNSKHKASEVEDLCTLCVWDIQLWDDCTKSKTELLKELDDLSTPSFKILHGKPYSIDSIEWNNKYKEDGIESIIDGWVIYDKDHKLKCALKFYFNESAEVKVKIEWLLSDKLGLIPKFNFKEVKLEGHKTKRCATNGINTLIEKNVGDGSTIVVARVNSTIPQMVSIIDRKPFVFPKCPTCKTQTSIDDVLKSVLYCPNPMCKDKINWVTHHVGNVTEEKFYNNTDKYTIDSMNLSSFNPSKKRKKKWIDEVRDHLLEVISAEDSEEFYNILKSHFDLNSDNRKKCKLLIPATIKVLKSKLNI